MLEVNGSVLWVGDEAATCSEAKVEAMACFEAKEEATVCSRARIKDDNQRQCGSVQSDRRSSAWRFQKIAKCCNREQRD
jgi:hypothetical protein